MDKLKLAILNICVPVAVSVFVFIGIYTNGFCSALEEFTLDSSSLQLIQGGLNEANQFSMTGQNISGLDPFSIFVVGATGDMLDRTNTLLGQKYGTDLTDLGFEINEHIESGTGADVSGDAVANNLSKGLYQTMAQATANGIRALTTKVILGGYATKMTILGMLNGNKIENALPNAYVKVNNDMINNLGSVASDLIENDELYNFSLSNHFLYGKSFSLYFSNQDIRFILNFTKPVVLCSDINSNTVYIICDTPPKTSIPCSGIIVIGNSTYNVTNCSYTNSGNPSQTIILNGNTYYCGTFFVNNTGSRVTCQSSIKYGNLSDTISAINGNGSTNFSVFYEYSNKQNIYNLLNQLMNKWVTTDDLKQINQAINDLQLGNISIDGQNLNVIDTSADKLTNIENLIQQILDRNSDLNSDNTFDNEVEPEPEPDPIENINQGIDIPTGFDNTLLNPFVDVIKLPFKFFTIFSPVFAIFGSSPLLSLWLFFPSFLIIMIIIWALK